MFTWEISFPLTGMKSKKQNQNCRAKTCCIVQDCRSFVDPCNFANNFNSYTFDVEIHAMSLWPLCCESEAILAKKVWCRSPRLECSYGKIFTLITEILGPLHIWAQSTELTRFPRSRLATLPLLKISISVTGPAQLLTRTHRNFHEGTSGEERKPS